MHPFSKRIPIRWEQNVKILKHTHTKEDKVKGSEEPEMNLGTNKEHNE